MIIIVPLDGSRLSEQALPVAASLAARHHASLLLLRVHSNPVPFVVQSPHVPPMQRLAQARAQAEEYLSDWISRIASAYGVRAKAELVLGEDVAATLQEHCTKIGAHLVIMATHGRGGFTRFWLGSVADSLVRHLTIPVLLIRERDDDQRSAPETTFHSLLIAVDGSPSSEQIIPSALKFGGREDVHYTLLMVDVPAPELTRPGNELLPELTRQPAAQSVQKYLAKLCERLTADGYHVSEASVMHPNAAQAILAHAKKMHADIIALATHGRGGARRFVLGSVADKVIRAASLPVLVQKFRDD